MYTVISRFDIFYEDYTPTRYVDISGKQLEYISLDGNKRIQTLFTTDPVKYLDKKYFPGSRY